MIINPSLPYGFVVFCDDIRQEITGKTTIVGAYGQQMIFQANPPANLGQLAVSTWYRFAPDERPSALEFRLVFEGESGEERSLNSARIDFPPGSFANVPEHARSAKDAHAQPYFEIQHIAQINAVTFSEPGRLKVRVYDGDNEIRIGTLAVGFLENLQEASNDSDQPR